MYDKTLVLEIVENLLLSITKIESRAKNIQSADDFLEKELSLILLDSICMQLIAIGQGIKDIDRVTEKRLLVEYPSIPWRNIAGIRDVLSHNYFNLNAEVVFGILGEDLTNLKNVLEIIRGDLK